MMISHFKKAFLVAAMSIAAMTAFAQDAPVYDVDSFPSQFDGQNQDPSAAPGPTHASAAPAKLDDTKMLASNEDTAAVEANKSLPMDQRVARLEQQINNSMNSDLTAKVTDLQSQVQTLRGQLDEMSHQMQLLQTQQKNMALDVDKRISAHQSASNDSDDDSGSSKSKKAKHNKIADSETADTSMTGLPPATSTTSVTDDTPSASAANAADQPNVAEEQQIYQTAYGFIKAKKYSDAAATLQKMLQKYPTGQFAANAHYWLGELYGLMGKNDQSVAEFTQVVKNYPDSPKLADAQLKLGLIYAAQLKWPDAKSAFKKVINHYPGTSSAHLASEQLKQIKQAGH
jgi:tol-pal system protein YbgF